MHGYGWAWPMGVMMLGWLVLVLLVIWAVWYVTTGIRQRPMADRHESARRILGERYARGELDTEEYHRRLDALR
ncbi:putative membrane protein [Micromonospora citrea]|uniref:Putative membrane protein n=2 Tax=Micromonospora citrea TaxID=47855 RepID=A0A1C6UWH4_9ACTN|nr:putative membrane protein [Micromonospora citrea]